jgi:mRNA interferase MazF
MKQGEIWHFNLDSTIGAKIRKSRPCLVLNSDKIGKLPLKIIAPLTEYKERYRAVPWMVRVVPSGENGLDKSSAVDLFQLRSVSEKRLVRKIGNVDQEILQQCKQAIDLVFAMGEE